ncbi:putative chaperone/heat shock protein Hsp12 [Sporormia fimetaria CBS 119925]|uniref:Chaperone/heat shock protein Hsp12 n=1 Tax=Sporormia fimetaria CBS 119925 TaxID=1340428 RepID=A0A6A6VQZ2_9PLEO|nr:putative chaperone/heat shock protein Hsp12 [Sporormia fimetaria CBS 119925]
MSDLGRKSFGDKASEKLQPDSTKSTTEKIGETITDTGDKVARGVVPDSEKSSSQSVGDKLSRGKDNEVHGGSTESVLDKAKNAVGLGDKH